MEEYNIELQGKNVVVIGRSNIVGKPMAQCLLEKNATVTICHSKTKNLQNITKQADVLIVIGNMIREALKSKCDCEKQSDSVAFKEMVILALCIMLNIISIITHWFVC